MYIVHTDFCGGFHPTLLSCEEAVTFRQSMEKDPWYCKFGVNGYHLFYTNEDDEKCAYPGCWLTWEALIYVKPGKPDPKNPLIPANWKLRQIKRRGVNK